jgi:hypothetical protein
MDAQAVLQDLLKLAQRDPTRPEGGSYPVQVTLCETGRGLHRLGRLENGVVGETCPDLHHDDIQDFLIESDTPFGRLPHVALAAQLSETPPHWGRPTAPDGMHKPEWPS